MPSVLMPERVTTLVRGGAEVSYVEESYVERRPAPASRSSCRTLGVLLSWNLFARRKSCTRHPVATPPDEGLETVSVCGGSCATEFAAEPRTRACVSTDDLSLKPGAGPVARLAIFCTPHVAM